MKAYLKHAILKLIKTYQPEMALKIVVKGLEESIKSSFPTSKVMNNALWEFYKGRFINLTKEDVDDVEMAGIVCGFESFIAGFLMGEGFSGNDIMNELGGEKWKEDIDKVFGT